MSHSIQYPSDYPEKAKAQLANVVELARSESWEELNETVICKDQHGNITAQFGDLRWNMSPYKQRRGYKEAFIFDEFSSTPALQLELKLIVYGWLFHKSSRTNQASSLTTLINRLTALKVTYHFLAHMKEYSLSALSQNTKWSAFEDRLIERNYNRHTIELIFTAINGVLRLQPWLAIDFGIQNLEPSSLSKS